MIKILLLLSIFSCSNIETLNPLPPKEIDKPISSINNTSKVIQLCEKIDHKFKEYNWGDSNCKNIQWSSVRQSHLGHPIMWTSFEGLQVKNTIILLCGVHPDEITPVKFCFDIIDDLNKNPNQYKESRIVIAPLVTVDPFFYKSPTRTNSRNIDINRNFPTKDWSGQALKLWKKKYGQDKRRFPGDYPKSEQETIFQINLVKLFNPNYIISVHAPLKLLDYDGPSLMLNQSKETKEILEQMSLKAGNYKITNYPFFPGSLGNWAGNERDIPTFTLELPDSDWNKTKQYFKTFAPAVYHVFSIQNK